MASGLLNNTGNLLRKSRNRLTPYKGKWQQTLNEQQAMEAVKKAAAAEQHEQQIPNAQPFLLSTLIDSFAIHACDPTPSAYSFLIKSLTKNSHFHHLPPVLNRIQHLEKFNPPEHIFVHLIKTYGQANKITDAIELFFKTPSFRCTPTALSLNALLSVLCKTQQGLLMIPNILFKSQSMNIRLEESSFRILITALCKIKRVGHAFEMLNMMSELGYDPDITLYSIILSAMCKIKHISHAEILDFFQAMRRKELFTPCICIGDYANVIGFMVKAEKVNDALSLMNEMKSDGIKPDVVIYTCVLNGVVMAGDFCKAEELFDEMLVLGVLPDIRTYNVYLKGLCLQCKFDAGFKLVLSIEELGCEPDVSTYNILLRGLCKAGEVKRAREEVLGRMRGKFVLWNLHTFTILINGLMHEGEALEACKLFKDMLSKGFVPMPSTCDEMMHGLCKLGFISEAVQMLTDMVGRGVIPGASTWQALLSVPHMNFEETASLDILLGGNESLCHFVQLHL